MSSDKYIFVLFLMCLLAMFIIFFIFQALEITKKYTKSMIAIMLIPFSYVVFATLYFMLKSIINIGS